MTTITVTHEDQQTDSFDFEESKASISLGRRSGNDVCIPDLSVSGNHALITVQHGNLVLEDLNSTNGTYVNGQVIKRTNIGKSDEIILGKVLISVSPSAAAMSTSAMGELPSSTEHPFSDHQSERLAERQSGHPDELAIDRPPGYRQDANNDALASPDREPLQGLRSAPSAANAASLQDNQNGDIATAVRSNPSTASEALGSSLSPTHDLEIAQNTSKGAVIEIKNGAKSGQILPIDKPVTTLGRPGIQIAAIMRKPDGYFLMHIESDNSVSCLLPISHWRETARWTSSDPRDRRRS